jgi:acyl-CoA synthetase (AMP-forming)/AMP-acid ligase II
MWLHADIKTLADIPRYYGKHAGDKIALISGTRTRSFRDLDLTSNRLANLIIRSGVASRSHVSFLGKNSIEYFETLFGANKAGCAMAPLNWRLTAAELALIIDDSQTPLLFVDREYRDVLAAAREKCASKFSAIEFDSSAHGGESGLDGRLARIPDVDPCVEIHPNDTALLLYTSGTTGKPKGVQITQQGLYFMRLCEHLEPAYSWQPGDVMMLVMPNFHLVGTGLSIQGLYNGAAVSILPVMDSEKVFAVIERDRPTICCLVPTAIQMLLDHPKAKTTDFSSLRLVMYAGSAISVELLKRALIEMKCRFMQFYGATETSGAATLLRPEQQDPQNEARLKSCGSPLPLVEIKIVNSQNEEVPQGTVGEFLIRSPSLFNGYWNQPEASALALQGGWYRTGDAGFRDAEGLYYITDRVKDMIVSGGENIYSTEVEQALCKHPAVRQAAVIGVPDDRWGEKVVAYIVLAEGSSVKEESLIEHCRTLIGGYKIPKAIKFINSLPLTSTGKILKRALRAQYSS